jgi:NAD(P) transhydrogenase subunit alpha
MKSPSLTKLVGTCALVSLLALPLYAQPRGSTQRGEAIAEPARPVATPDGNARAAAEIDAKKEGSAAVEPNRQMARQTLMVSITIFVLAIFVGYELINKVPATLHTPLMSGSNAISGITVVGAIIVAGAAAGVAPFLGFVAVVLAMINVVGGFLVTHRMLLMFKRR